MNPNCSEICADLSSEKLKEHCPKEMPG